LVACGALLLGACSSSGDGEDVASGDSQTDDTSGTSTSTTVGDGPATGDPLPSPGCGTSEVTAVTEQERTLDVGGTPRRYLQTVPEAHDGETPVPVVLDFHGLLEGAEIHSQMSQYSPLAQEEGFVAIFPHGSGEPVRWDANPNSADNQDLAYFDAMMDQLGSELCIDTSRIYATGLSYGAIMLSMLMCTRADEFAAVAPLSGLSNTDPCASPQPLPILAYHGTDDPILLFNGGFDLGAIPGMGEGATATTRPPADLDGEGYPATVAIWAERNGCEPEPTDTEVTPEVIHRVYNCPEGADVESYIIVGGGHAWPGSEFSKGIEQIVGHTTFDIDATAASWEFFQRFQLK
jgi:polyhydroxybutyrate depolymerase